MMTIRIASIQALTFLTATGWMLSHSSDPVSLSPTREPSVALRHVSAAKPSKIWASDSILYHGDTLELHFTTPNAPFLGVIDPMGHFFYLVFPGDDAVENLKPLVESKQFVAMQTLKIDTQSLLADPYTYGVYTNQPVFTTSGKYTFILGEDLHVDDPGLIDKVSVRYINESRHVHIQPVIAIN